MKKILKKIDIPLLVITIIICCIGLFMVFSSSSIAAIHRYNKAPTFFFIKQLKIFLLAFVFGSVILFIPTKLYKSIANFAIIIVIGSLIALLLYGTITNHIQGWFYIPHTPFAIQPSEFAKTAIIMFMAYFYNNLVQKKSNRLILYLIPLMVAFLIMFLIMFQPDLGSSIIFIGIAFLIFISIPTIRKNINKILLILGGAAILLVIVFLITGKAILSDEQKSRFQFNDPCKRYTDKSGYQVCNGFIAINNGKLFGVGIGKSTQKYSYLPESHTDFIFPILVEELGLLAGIGILILYGLLLYRILKIAKEAYNLRNSILAYGTFLYFTFHILINLLGVLSLMPLTGVPLPLLSYGGSATINFIAILYITQRVSIENKETKYKLEIQKLKN